MPLWVRRLSSGSQRCYLIIRRCLKLQLHLLNGDNEDTALRKLWEMNKLINVTYLSQCLVQHKCSLNMSYYTLHCISVSAPNTPVRTLSVPWLLLKIELCSVRGERPKTGSLTLNAVLFAGDPVNNNSIHSSEMPRVRHFHRSFFPLPPFLNDLSLTESAKVAENKA